MKKVILICSFLCMICCVSANSGDKFIDALRDCSSFSDDGIVNVNGIEAKSVKRMVGWQSDKCVYKETLNFSGRDYTTVCKFSRAQINEIVSVADAYFLTLKHTNQQPDLYSLDAIQNNPVANVMSKYLQDASVCSMSGME